MFAIDVENINGKTETLSVFGEYSILTELENHNIFPSYNCRQGICGECILKLLSGNITHRQKPEWHLSPGEILACLAVPVSDIKIGLRDF